MSEETGRTIRIPVAELIVGHKIRTIVISRSLGIKALYDCKRKIIVTYVLDKSKSWTPESGLDWVNLYNEKSVKSFKEVSVDQEDDFIKLSVEYVDGSLESFEPSYGKPFIVTDEMVKEQGDEMNNLDKAKDKEKKPIFCSNCGWNGTGKKGSDCPDCGSKTKDKPAKKDNQETKEKGHTARCKECGDKREIDEIPKKKAKCKKCGGYVVYKSEGVEVEVPDEEGEKSEDVDYGDSMDIIKADKAKQLVYGVFLWPDKADTDGDIISSDDIEKVAHKFLIEYRDIDEMHKKQTLDAEIVESFIAWMDNLEYYGKILKRGAWAGAIHVSDADVWEKIEKGEYKGFSVRISGRREPVGNIEEGVDG